MFRFYTKKVISLAVLAGITGTLYTPLITHKAAPPAQAVTCATCEQEAAAAIRDARQTIRDNLEYAGLSANIANTAASVAVDNALELKEFVLDGLAYYVAEVALREITRSIVNWINSGFEGSPAFVTDLEGFLLDIADQEAGAFIYGSQLGFLCSPFQLDIRIALATQYAQERDFQTQCTLSQVSDNIEGFLSGAFDQGGWPAWFELTQDAENTPQGAYFKAKAGLDIAIRDAKGREIELLSWGDGFFSFEACTEVRTPRSGSTQTDNRADCTMTTPGSVIQEQLNETLKFGSQRLIVADEIDEIVGALLAQLTQQVITGAYGLLGLGGSSFADRDFGNAGNNSYLDALGEEDVAVADADMLDRIRTALDTQDAYAAVQFEIRERTEAEAEQLIRIRAREDLVPGCFDLTLSPRLARALTAAERAIINAEPLQRQLLELEARSLLAETRNDEIAIAEDFTELTRSRTLKTESDVLVAEGFLDFEINTEIREFQDDIDDEIVRCLIPPEEDDEEEEISTGSER